MFNSLPTFLTNLLILNKRKNVPPSGKSYPSPRVRRKRTQRSRGGNPARVSSAAAIYQPKKKSRTSPSAAARGFLPVLWLHIERAFCTDIGESPKPQVTAYSLEVRKCRNCGRTLRGQHPQVDPSQHGATAHRVGTGPGRTRSCLANQLRAGKPWMITDIGILPDSYSWLFNEFRTALECAVLSSAV